MNGWINLDALWRIVVIGLIAGAGLPALFAIGLRALSLPARGLPGGAGGQAARAGGESEGSEAIVGGSVPGMIAAALCFLIVLASIGWGIYAIYKSGHPHS